MESYLIKILINEFDYNEYEAKETAIDMINSNDELSSNLKQWIDNRYVEDYIVKDYSIRTLITEHHMTYPQAFIMINWMIQDYETALECLNSPMR